MSRTISAITCAQVGGASPGRVAALEQKDMNTAQRMLNLEAYVDSIGNRLQDNITKSEVETRAKAESLDKRLREELYAFQQKIEDSIGEAKTTRASTGANNEALDPAEY